MLLSYHLPILDLRPFLPKPEKKLAIPNWATPRSTDFIRGFGGFSARHLGGDNYFGGSRSVFNAQGALRFLTSDPEISLPGSNALKVDCKFRRFFAFNRQVAKIELGLVPKHGMLLPSKDISANDILDGLFDLPVSIVLTKPSVSQGEKNERARQERVESSLGSVGLRMAEALLRASTPLRDKIDTQKWWVQAGAPMAILEVGKNEPVLLPPCVRKLDYPDNSFDVYIYDSARHKTVNYIVKRKNDKVARARSRILRIILGYLHCHVQTALMLNVSLRRKDRINPFQGTPYAVDVKKHVNEQKEILDGIIREGVSYKISGLEEIKLSLPDTAEMRIVAKELSEWNPEKPGFFRRLFIDFSNLSIKEFIFEAAAGDSNIVSVKVVAKPVPEAEAEK